MKSKKDTRKAGKKDVYSDKPMTPKGKNRNSVKQKKKHIKQELYDELDEFENLNYNGNLKFPDEEY